MYIFWSIAAVATALLILNTVVGDFLDGVFDSFDFADGWLSSTGILSFLATFGLTGGLLMASTELSILVCSLVAVAAGAVVALAAGVGTRALQQGATAHQITATDYLAKTATVSTSIPAGGIGQVQLTVSGHPTTLAARADATVGAGTQVLITDVISPGLVKVVTQH